MAPNFDDLKYILPESLRLTDRKLQLILIGVIGALVVTCIVLACLVGLHAGGVMGPGSPGAGGSGPGFLPITSQACTTTSCLETAARLMENIDKTADPCTDFYTYACGGWQNRHTIPPDRRTITVTGNLQQENNEKLRELIDSRVQRRGVNSSERKLKDFFKMCVHDYGRMKEAGTELLSIMQDYLKGWYVLDPDNWQNNGWNLNDAISNIQGELNVDVLMRISVGLDYRRNTSTIRMYSGGIGMYYRYYLRDDKRGIKEAYKDYMRDVGALLVRDANLTLTGGEMDARVEQFVSDAYGQEEHLAMLRQEVMQEEGSYRATVTTVSELEANFTQLPWREMVQKAFDGFDVTDNTQVLISQFKYFQKVDQLLRNETADKDRIMNNYMMWQLASGYSRYLSWEYKAASYKYYEKAYGQRQFRPSWEECLSLTRYRLGSALAAEFLRNHVNIKSKREVEKMFEHMKTALYDSIDHLHWMDNDTKANAQEKVDSVVKNIGFPDSYFNQTFLDQLHSKLTINKTDGFFRTFLNVQRFQRHMRTREIKAGMNYYMWSFVLSGGGGSASAYYFWRNNFLLVPPGAMQFPLYSPSNPGFMNFGGLGTNMADELAESISEQGRYLWMNGSWADWWTPQTVSRYLRAKNCFSNYFEGTIVGPFFVDGENKTVVVTGNRQARKAVDLVAGIRTALKAYHDWASNDTDQVPVGINMSPEQAFFVSTAQAQCFKTTPETAYMYARYQMLSQDLLLNGALSHMKEFQEAFKCGVDSKMVANGTCYVF